MNRRNAYISRRSASLGLKKRLIGVTVLAAASCAAVLALLLAPDQVLATRSSAAGTTVPTPTVASASPSLPASASASATIARRVYPYSIIPGGVSGRDELARAIKTDKVVAAHYASFDVDKAVKLTVAKPRAVHVSYRKGDMVYWTKNKLMLAEGETLLSDGRSELRARCANRISDVPQFPVEPNEPTAEELDSVVSVAMDTAGLGLDDADFAGDGFMNGLGVALASSEPPSSNNVNAKSRSSISANPAPLSSAEPVPGRRSIVGSVPGNSPSGSTAGKPIVVAPSQSGELWPPSSTTPGPDGTPVPPSVSPGTLPPPPGVPPAEGPESPLPLPLFPEPPQWPPGNLPEEPGENVHEVPEPDTLWLSAAAFAGMLLLRRRYRACPAIKDC